MKHLILLTLILLLLFLSCLGQEKSKTNVNTAKTVEKCSPNIDQTYNRQRVLEQLADILNKSVPEYFKIFRQRFAVENERGNLFFVFDLTDSLNNPRFTACIEFKENHIYHFASLDYNFSYSHLVILENGKLKVFKSINCFNKKSDKLEDVISYLDQKLKDDKDKTEIIERVKNFRKYGIYFYEDAPIMPCQDY